MTRYKVEYTTRNDQKTQIVVQDHLDRKKEQLERYLMQMVKHQSGFKKAKVEKNEIKFRHKLIKDSE